MIERLLLAIPRGLFECKAQIRDCQRNTSNGKHNGKHNGKVKKGMKSSEEVLKTLLRVHGRKNDKVA